MKIAILAIVLLAGLIGFIVVAPAVLGYGLPALVVVLLAFWLVGYVAEKKRR